MRQKRGKLGLYVGVGRYDLNGLLAADFNEVADAVRYLWRDIRIEEMRVN